MNFSPFYRKNIAAAEEQTFLIALVSNCDPILNYT